MDYIPETTPGGRALQYYASLRLKCLRRTANKDLPGATNMRIKIIKTRLGPDYTSEIIVPFIHGKGPATVLDTIDVARKFEMIRFSAGVTKIRWNPDEGDDAWVPLLDDIEKGKQAGINAIATTPWLLNKLKQACFTYANLPDSMELEDVLKIGPTEEENDGGTDTTEDREVDEGTSTPADA